jgi:hypothetical protein
MIFYERGGVVVRESVEADIYSLAPRLRRKDAEEALAEGYESSEAALCSSFARSSYRLTVEREGVPVAMLGLVPPTLTSEIAQAWLLGSAELALMKKTFVRLSPVVIKLMLERHAILYNSVDCRYPETISWLKRMGAKFEAPEPFGPEGRDFQQFMFRRA